MSQNNSSATVRTVIDNIVRVLKANSGMFLSSALIIVLFLLWLGDGFAGHRSLTDASLYLVFIELAGLWLTVSAVLALDAISRINKSFNGAEGMLWWNRYAMICGYLVTLLGAILYWSIVGFQTTPATTAVDIVLAVCLAVLGVAMVLRYVGPNTGTPRTARLRRLLGRISFDVIYPIFMVILVATWAVLGWHIWAASSLTEMAEKGGPCQIIAWSIVIAFAVFAVLHSVLWQRYKNDRRYPGTVVQVARPNSETAIITVELDENAFGRRSQGYLYTAGQYSYLGVPESKSRPHPFTMTSIPNVVGRTGPTVNIGIEPHMRTQGIAWDQTVEYCVKSSGAGTAWLVENVKEGQAVTVSTPRGGTHPARGGARQLWVAGGIGITPFVAWLRDIEANSGSTFPAQVTLVWSFRGSENLPYRAYVERCAAEWPWLTLVEINTEDTDRITPEQATELAFQNTDSFGLLTEDVTVYLCGPTAMCNSFRSYLWGRGISPHRLFTDSFHMR